VGFDLQRLSMRLPGARDKLIVSLRARRAMFEMPGQQRSPRLRAAVADAGQPEPEVAIFGMVGNAPARLDDMALGGVEPERPGAGRASASKASASAVTLRPRPPRGASAGASYR
jgi:hypothetical protein